MERNSKDEIDIFIEENRGNEDILIKKQMEILHNLYKAKTRTEIIKFEEGFKKIQRNLIRKMSPHPWQETSLISKLKDFIEELTEKNEFQDKVKKQIIKYLIKHTIEEFREYTNQIKKETDSLNQILKKTKSKEQKERITREIENIKEKDHMYLFSNDVLLSNKLWYYIKFRRLLYNLFLILSLKKPKKFDDE